MGGIWSQHGCDQRLRPALPKRRGRDGERDGGPRDSRWRPHRSDKDRVSTYRTLQGKVKANQAVFQDLTAPRQVWTDILTPRRAGIEASRGRQASTNGERPGHCQSTDLWFQETGPFNFVGRYRRKHIQTQEEKLQAAPANRAQSSRKKRKLTTRKRYQQSNPAEIRIGPPAFFSPPFSNTHVLSSHPKTSQL